MTRLRYALAAYAVEVVSLLLWPLALAAMVVAMMGERGSID